MQSWLARGSGASVFFSKWPSYTDHHHHHQWRGFLVALATSAGAGAGAGAGHDPAPVASCGAAAGHDPSPASGVGPIIIEAIARRKDWKRGAGFYRDRGLISAVVSDPMLSDGSRSNRGGSSTSSMLVFLKEQQMAELLRCMGQRVFMSTVFTMRISNSLLLPPPHPVTFTQSVLPRTVNFNDAGGITNIRFVKADPGIKLKLNCPIVFTGEAVCKGIKKGGALKKYYTYLPLSCAPEMIPTVIEVDIQNLGIGEQVLVEDVKCKVDLHPDLDPSAPICRISEV